MANILYFRKMEIGSSNLLFFDYVFQTV